MITLDINSDESGSETNTKTLDYLRGLGDLNRFLTQLTHTTKIMSTAMRDLFQASLDSTKMKDKFGKLAKLIESALTKKREESRRAIIAALTLHHILWAHTSLMIRYTDVFTKNQITEDVVQFVLQTPPITHINEFIELFDFSDYVPPESTQDTFCHTDRFLRHEKLFGVELLALLGYFGQKMKNLELGDIRGVFDQGGEMQQMLAISKRFSDQIDDMHQTRAEPRENMGVDTLKELQNENNDIRIADIFHDVARGQHLTVFFDYTRRLFPHGPFPELDHVKMFDALQDKVARSIDHHHHHQVITDRQKLCLMWLLPELLIRPIYRAFTLVADIDEIKEKFDQEYRDLSEQFHDRREYLLEEMGTLKKVSDDANLLAHGLRDWIEQHNSSSATTWLKKYKKAIDTRLKNCWYESSKGSPNTPSGKDKALGDMMKKATLWEKQGRFWNSHEATDNNYFWDDVQRIFEPVELTDLKVNKKNLKLSTLMAPLAPKKSWRCYLVRRQRGDKQPFGMLILDAKHKLELKIDDIQGDKHGNAHTSDIYVRQIQIREKEQKRFKVEIRYFNKVQSVEHVVSFYIDEKVDFICQLIRVHLMGNGDSTDSHVQIMLENVVFFHKE